MKKFEIIVNRVKSVRYEVEADNFQEALKEANKKLENENWADIEPEYNYYSEDE